MATIEIKDVKGAAAGTVELSDAVFAIEPNVPVMHRTVKAQQASWRQGTANTRTRGMVRGGGKKPWRQKGTGRARQGTIRAPQWVGGGTVFGPHTRSYDQKVNKKEIKLAMRSALSAKLADGELFIVKDMDFEKPCTKDAVALIKALGLEGKRIWQRGHRGLPLLPQHPRGEHSAGGRYQHLRAGRQQGPRYRRAVPGPH